MTLWAIVPPYPVELLIRVALQLLDAMVLTYGLWVLKHEYEKADVN